jgi:hypothetical protein
MGHCLARDGLSAIVRSEALGGFDPTWAEGGGALHSAFAALSRRRPCGGGSKDVSTPGIVRRYGIPIDATPGAHDVSTPKSDESLRDRTSGYVGKILGRIKPRIMQYAGPWASRLFERHTL